MPYKMRRRSRHRPASHGLRSPKPAFEDFEPFSRHGRVRPKPRQFLPLLQHEEVPGDIQDVKAMPGKGACRRRSFLQLPRSGL
jgi:hypothetical protein